MEEAEDVKFAEINCMDMNSLDTCSEEGVEGFPAVQLYKDGTLEDIFSEERTVEKLENFVWQTIDPSRVSDDSIDDFLQLASMMGGLGGGQAEEDEEEYEDCDCSEPDCECEEGDADYDDEDDIEEYDDEDEGEEEEEDEYDDIAEGHGRGSEKVIVDKENILEKSLPTNSDSLHEGQKDEL